MTSVEESAPMERDHEHEPHGRGVHGRLNWLRAGVLGANDGIVSTAGLVVGVAGATTSRPAILIAGIAGLVAGAMSMAVGEYVSVSTQRDSEEALLALERRELAEMPEEELEELTQLYVAKGLSRPLAAQVARELTEHDALSAHAETELGIDPDELTNAWQAALASFVAFTVGALLPLLAIVVPAPPWRVPITFVSVVAALALTGWGSARLGGSGPHRAVWRNVVGGAVAMAVTFAIGNAVGLAV
ncbi:MAG TPA: VIT family protein [Segeticoccus sp.]|jgi:VIT1/CCC1 family predicted Fe2+/Mn2+ transporter|nr:VIT family protein [Segeticoccus sp.]